MSLILRTAICSLGCLSLTALAQPTEWTATNMHPSWADGDGSQILDVSGGQQVGFASVLTDVWDDIHPMGKPTIWAGTPESAIDVTPAGTVAGSLLATNGTTQTGWWWYPYDCWSNGRWTTCYIRYAGRWQGSAASHEDLHVGGWEYSSGLGVSSTQIGGSITNDNGSNTWTHAALWPTSGSTNATVLHPGGAENSWIGAIDGDSQFGSVDDGAAGWTGTPGSYVDMHPSTGSRSYIKGAGDGQQVGYISVSGANHAGLWTGTAESFVDLHPVGSGLSTAYDCMGGYQVGVSYFADGRHALIWAGEAEVFVDLNDFLPPELSDAEATSMDILQDGTIIVGGHALNTTTGIRNAVMWTSAAASCPADFNGDGEVNTLDVLAFLNVWSAGDMAADFNGDGEVNTLDMLAFLNAWTTGC